MQTVLTENLQARYSEAVAHEPRTHYFHEGPYHGGHSFFSYYMKDEGVVVFDGPFYYQYSFVSPFGTVFLSEAKGSFKHGLKDGKWTYLDKGDTHQVHVTMDYVRGHATGAIVYEALKPGRTPERPIRTALSFRCVHGRLIGEVEGLLNGRDFKAKLGDGDMANDDRQMLNDIIKVMNQAMSHMVRQGDLGGVK